MNKCIFAFVNREPTALLMEICDEGTDYLEKTLPEHVTVVKSLEEVDPKKFKLVILVTPYNLCVPYGVLELHFVPMIASLGFGLASHPDNYEDIYDEIDETMSQIGVLPCYKCYCTIDVKQDEEFCAMLVDDLGEELVFYSAEELAQNRSETCGYALRLRSSCHPWCKQWKTDCPQSERQKLDSSTCHRLQIPAHSPRLSERGWG